MIRKLIDMGRVALAAECFVNVSVRSEHTRNHLMSSLYGLISGGETDRERAGEVLSKIILIAPEMFSDFFREFVVRSHFLEFAKDLMNSPSQRSGVRKTILIEALELARSAASGLFSACKKRSKTRGYKE